MGPICVPTDFFVRKSLMSFEADMECDKMNTVQKEDK